MQRDQIKLEFGWSAAFKIAWAIVIVQAIVGVVGFVLFVGVLHSLIH